MKNIKEYLKSSETNIKLYHKNGEKSLWYWEESNGFWSERTYDSNGRGLTHKDSNGDWGEYTRDSNGQELTFKDSNGYWSEYTRDSNGQELTYKDSNAYWSEYTYDSSGNELTFKNSRGVERGFGIEEMTMEQVCKALGKTIKITK